MTDFADKVDIWQVPLDRPPAEAAWLRSLLTPEEMRKADGFHFEKDRRRYAVARGALRAILAERVGAAPEALRFTLGSHGKPFLTGGPEFNLSHCEDLALIAVAPAGRAVGVDAEKVRSFQDMRSIEERYFSAEERGFLAAAGPAERARRFLTLWTRREAAAKALGLDLQAALTRVRLPLYDAGGSAALSDPAGQGSGPWNLQDLPLDHEHVAALCAQGPACGVVLHEATEADFHGPRL